MSKIVVDRGLVNMLKSYMFNRILKNRAEAGDAAGVRFLYVVVVAVVLSCLLTACAHKWQLRVDSAMDVNSSEAVK